MFILTKVADLVRITPADFSKNSLEAIEDNINTKYANKVIQKIGLCICMYDLLWASEGLIGHGDGFVNVNVEFRLVVFRPFKGEVLIGRISSSSLNGIHLKTDFFNDIFVEREELPDGCVYDHGEQSWVWETGEERFYWDNGEMVRFGVIGEDWHDQTPTKPVEYDEDPEEVKYSPYTIRGTMKDAGLGCCIWW